MRAREELERRLLRWVQRHGLLSPGDRVLVAVSGGSDSTALLHLLAASAPRQGWQLGVVHVDHRWRPDSGADADWVGAESSRLGLPFFRGVLCPEAAVGNREQAARRARYAFFAEAAAEFGASSVATGHTGDDQAETVLLRVLRGSGTAGLAGILPLRGSGPAVAARASGGGPLRVVRPVLFARRAELRAWLRHRGQGWREDATNADRERRRNWIRHELLPLLHVANPEIVTRLGTLAEIAREEERFWSEYLDRLSDTLWQERAPGWRAPRARLAALPLAVLRRMLRHAMQRVQNDLLRVEFSAIEELAEWIHEASQPPRQRQLGRCRWRVSSQWVDVRPASPAPVGRADDAAGRIGL